MKSGLVVACLLQASVVCAQSLDHPIITEVFTDPPSIGDGTMFPTKNDGPVGRVLTNPHQEYIEIFLPTAGDLRTSLNKDNLRLTFYEVEGDSSSSGVELINYRFDLPSFDLDPSNGMTAGTLPRPTSGVVVLGWVDYVGDPPVDLAGTPSTRTGLILDGITVSPPGVTFIAMNGNHFSGTTNFPTLVAESLIDILNNAGLSAEVSSGVIQNGSSAYLLVNRDSVGYVELYDDKDPFCFPTCAGPVLPNDFSGLRTSALLDGFASNDDSLFLVEAQPYISPTGNDIDLETVLPAGGAFSQFVPQIPETVETGQNPGTANGYARRFVDAPKTTENATAFDDDPVLDALNAYDHVRNAGPFFPTPGEVTFTTSPPKLSVACSLIQNIAVLSQTTSEVSVISANVGGNFGMDIAATPGASSDATTATFSAGTTAGNVGGQTLGLPSVAITGQAAAVNGASATASVTVTGSNTVGGDPSVVSPVHVVDVTATVLNPTTGLDALGQPFQATVFVAIQGIPADAGVSNEFLGTDLATFIQANLGAAAQETRGITATLLNPLTNLNDGLLVNTLRKDFPDPGFFLNFPAPPVIGKLDVVQTLLQSAEVQSGRLTYDGVVAPDLSGLFAIRMNVPDTITFGGTFSPSEPVSFVGPTGALGDPTSGLTSVTTSRTFEIALIDTQVRDNSVLSTGNTDDFGLMIEVQDTEPGSPVVDGEFVFLSFTGGLQGADVDTVNVPPGNNVATIIYLDLDNLHDVLGIISIEQVIIVDGNGSGEVDLIEAYSLNAIPGACMASSAPIPATVEGPIGGQVIDTSNRTLRFSAGIPGRSQAIRVTFVDLPIPYDVWNGTTMWVGKPRQISEIGGLADSTPPTMTAATLQCDLNVLSFQNWSAFGTITVYHEGIVPGGRYSVDVLDITCSPFAPADFSDAVVLDTGIWGDVVGEFSANGTWTAPNSSTDVVSDVVALIQKFASLPTAPLKARCDIEPATLDFSINITDITFALQAFQGRGYPFVPPPGPACP